MASPVGGAARLVVSASGSGALSGAAAASLASAVSIAPASAACHPIDDDQVKQYSDLECSVCCALAWDPMVPPCNVHVFCRACILQWLSRNSSCPACKVRTAPADLKPLAVCNPIAYRMVGAHPLRSAVP